MSGTTDDTADPVTLVVRRRPRAGHEREFEARLQDLLGHLRRAPGHRATNVVRPSQGQQDYTLVVQFDSAQQAADWEASPERSAWAEQLTPLSSPPRVQRQPGLEYWFTPPGSPTLAQPPRWKMALLTLLMIYPLSLAFAALISPELPDWPLPLRTLLSSLLIVPMMTWVSMPGITRLCAGWLSADRGEETRFP
ncbi:antibiotic biosynthesis monooxygenase [Deinococcus sp.]|uniref:antibiotic biosynthesis monooxygenase n=1 Tax=Deinococcus sp. TaxID=47478 RepID=UPI003B5C7CD8